MRKWAVLLFFTLTAVPVTAIVYDNVRQQKLDSIVIDKINFHQVDLQLAIDYLNEASKANDPDHQGVRIFLQIPTGGLKRPMPEITLSVTEVPLKKVLASICEQADANLLTQGDLITLDLSRFSPKDALAVDRVRNHASEIVLRRVHFDKLDVASAIEILNRMVKQQDPAHTGLNIVFVPPPADSRMPHLPVSLELQNVPLIDLLGYVVEQSNDSYSFEPGRIVVREPPQQY